MFVGVVTCLFIVGCSVFFYIWFDFIYFICVLFLFDMIYKKVLDCFVIV